MNHSSHSYFSNHYLNRIVWTILILSLALNIYYWIYAIIVNPNLNSWGYSEFLINFSGGFVRRGLSGDILLWITATTGITPQWLITPACIVAYLTTLIFFLHTFKKRGYNQWIILSAVFCGFVCAVIRKDFILYLVLILMLTLVRGGSPTFVRRILASVIAAFGLMLHEAFIFWGIPVFALALLADKKQRVANCLLLTTLLGIFIILCIYKGNSSIAHAIVSSWNNLIPDEPLKYMQQNSIGALTWDTKSTILFHIKKNIGDSCGCMGIIYWPVFYMAVYYFVTFFFTVFIPDKDSFGIREQTSLSTIFGLVSICMLPMFTALNCDYGRLFQYITISSFAAFFILPTGIRSGFISDKINNRVMQLNTAIARFLPPSKGLITILLLFIGVSPCYFNIYQSIELSPAGCVGMAAIRLMNKVYSIIL